MRKLWGFAALACITGWAAPSSADDEPSFDTTELVALGAGLAVPVDLLVTTQHEGSHALAATIFGAHVTSVRPYPVEVDGHLRFGQTTWTGRLTNGQLVAVMLAPKMTDLVGLSTFAALEMTGSLPDNQLAGIVILTVATAVWADFTVDIGATWDKSDLGVVYSVIGANDELSRLPYRLLQGGIAAVAAVPIVHGYVRVFGKARHQPGEKLGAHLEPWADLITDLMGEARGQVFGLRGTF